MKYRRRAGDTSDEHSNFSDPGVTWRPYGSTEYANSPFRPHPMRVYSHPRPQAQGVASSVLHPDSRDSDASDATKPPQTRVRRNLSFKPTRHHRRLGPDIRDITDEFDMGYEGDVEVQLPDDYEEASEAEQERQETSVHAGMQGGNNCYEDVLVKGLQKLNTEELPRAKSKKQQKQTPRRNRLKRRHSPSSNDEEGLEIATRDFRIDGRPLTAQKRHRKRLQSSWSESAPSAVHSDGILDIEMDYGLPY